VQVEEVALAPVRPGRRHGRQHLRELVGEELVACRRSDHSASL
jgi:hypothetical protein